MGCARVAWAWSLVLAGCAGGPASERQRLGVEGYGTTEQSPVPMLVVPLDWRDGIAPPDLAGAGTAGRAPAPGELGALVAPMALTDQMTDGVLYGTDAYVPWVDQYGALAFVVRPELGAIDAPWVSGQEPVSTTAVIGTAWLIDALFGTAVCVTIWGAARSAFSPEGRAATAQMTRDLVDVGQRAWAWMVSRAQPVPNEQAVTNLIDRAVARARESLPTRDCSALATSGTTTVDAVPLGFSSFVLGRFFDAPEYVSIAPLTFCRQGRGFFGIARSPTMIRSNPMGVLVIVLANVGRAPVTTSFDFGLGGFSGEVPIPGPGVFPMAMGKTFDAFEPMRVRLSADGTTPVDVPILDLPIRE